MARQPVKKKGGFYANKKHKRCERTLKFLFNKQPFKGYYNNPIGVKYW